MQICHVKVLRAEKVLSFSLRVDESSKWGQGRETYHIQCDHSVELDQAMEPAKDDRYGKEYDIGGISNIMTEILDEFAEKHPYKKTVNGKLLMFLGPFLQSFPQQPHEYSVPQECRG